MSIVAKDYAELRRRAIALKSRLDAQMSLLQDSKSKLVELTRQAHEQSETARTLEQSSSLLRQIIDVLSKDHISKAISLVNFGLKSIFTDRSYSLEYTLEDGKSIELFLNEYLSRKDAEGVTHQYTVKSDMDSIGGGVLVVIGFILQVYYLSYYKGSPVMFLDEAFSQLSSTYVGNFFTFIKMLAEKGYIFVLVSHDDRFIDQADRVYYVDKGKVVLRRSR